MASVYFIVETYVDTQTSKFTTFQSTETDLRGRVRGLTGLLEGKLDLVGLALDTGYGDVVGGHARIDQNLGVGMDNGDLVQFLNESPPDPSYKLSLVRLTRRWQTFLA